jgi:hypothetical protein
MLLAGCGGALTATKVAGATCTQPAALREIFVENCTARLLSISIQIKKGGEISLAPVLEVKVWN